MKPLPWVWMWTKWTAARLRRRTVSILVPINIHPDTHRAADWKWLKQYWRYHYPTAELVIGQDAHVPFSKTRAVNNAASRAHGNIFVIADADCFIDINHVKAAIAQIQTSRHRLWMIPYRRFYRLSEQATARILRSSPHHPYHEPTPPPPSDIEPGGVDPSHYGHHYAAMIMILPRQAFYAVGGMDPRFCGWGGEDISFMYAVDTLWGPHKTSKNDVLHLYHEHIGENYQNRKWEGQLGRAVPQHWLASAYNRVRNDPAKMRELVDQGWQPEGAA